MTWLWLALLWLAYLLLIAVIPAGCQWWPADAVNPEPWRKRP